MSFDEIHWSTLVQRVVDRECLPIIGAGASAPHLPLAGQLSRELATHLKRHAAPDPSDLEQVAQRLAVECRDAVVAKRTAAKIIQRFLQALPSSVMDDSHTHVLLADLALPMYLTTNYDNLMQRAISQRNRDPVQDFCRWNASLQDHPSPFDTAYTPSVGSPLVFHLHGHIHEPRTMVISEDDYLDFLVNLAIDLRQYRQRQLLPVCLKDALKNFTLLFIGYRLRDVNFRVILRGLLGTLSPSERTMSVTVQLPPRDAATTEEAESLQAYMKDYFNWSMNLQVYWGTAGEFMTELRERVALARGETV